MFKNTTNLQILQFLVICAGCLFAWFAGGDVSDENYIPILAVLGALAAICVVFGLGRSVYYLIPIFWALTGQISVLPLPFSVRQLVIIVSGVIFLSDLIFKSKLKKFPLEMIDILLWVNVLYLVTVFVRHPVGVGAIGAGDRIGGKPYLDAVFSILVYLILTRNRISPHFAQRLPWWILIVAAFTAVAGAIGVYFPSIGSKLSYLYSGFGAMGGLIGVGDDLDASGEMGVDRLVFLDYLGTVICLYVVCKISPLKMFSDRNLKYGVAYLIGVVMVLLSGFRDSMIQVILATALATILADRVLGFAKLLFVIVLISLMGVSLSYTSLKLPFTFQRTLSFLPGNWDSEAVESARDSSEWRYDMWRTLISSDRYMHDKIFGDGFGLSREDFEIQAEAMLHGGQAYSGDMAAQEAFMINGDYHSGPLTTIHVVGCIGLVFFLTLMVQISLYAYRLIRETEGSPYQLVALYVGIPTIYAPFLFIFIFGGFKDDLVNVIYSLAILKLIKISYQEYRTRQIGQATTDSQNSLAKTAVA